MASDTVRLLRGEFANPNRELVPSMYVPVLLD